MIKRVIQRQYKKGDCGVACVAMVTGKSYAEIESLFHKYDLVVDGEYYTRHKDLKTLLEDLGHEVERKRFSGWKNVQYPSIVKVNVRAGDCWHWVVKADDRKIFDPKPGAPDVVTDYRGRRGDGYYLHIKS